MNSAPVIWFLNGAIQQQEIETLAHVKEILKGDYEVIKLTDELHSHLPQKYNKFHVLLIGKNSQKVVKENNSSVFKMNVNTFMSLSITHRGAAIFIKERALQKLIDNEQK